MKKTGLQINKLAIKNGYSVKDIQTYLSLSCPQPVYRWYKGSILPSVDNLLKLSELFGVHMEDLLVKKYVDNRDIENIDYSYLHEEFAKRIMGYASILAA